MNTLSLHPSSNQTLHPIQVVARRTGLSADVIRAWERRYQAVEPQRSTTDRRLYSDEDVARLTLLRRVTQAGRRISDVARLPLPTLQQLVVEEAAIESVAEPALDSEGDDRHLTACLQAVQRLDAVALEASLATAARTLSMPRLLTGLVGGLLERVGQRWRLGLLRPCHEHLATTQLRLFLGGLLSTANMADSGPSLLVATPTGQRHELGALMVAVTAAQSGWRPLYLGPDLPSDDIAFAATALDLSAVALSLTYPADDPRLPVALRRLRQQLPTTSVLLVGGAAMAGYQRVLDEIRAWQVHTLEELQAALDRLRQPGVNAVFR